jgi:hypothetical protein
MTLENDNTIDQNETQNNNQQQDDLAEYRSTDGQFDPEKIRKLADDKKYYRTQISKLRQVPQKREEYSKDFVLDSKFNEYAGNEENKKRLAEIFDRIDEMSMIKGIGIERNHDIRRLVLDELVAQKAIDLTTPAQKEAEELKIITERNAKVRDIIGNATDIEAWNNAIYDWLKGFCNSEAEYQMHKKLIERNSVWALSMNKVRHAMMGNRIPVAISEPKYNEAEWTRAFQKATKEEQDKMLEERAKNLIKNRK